MYTAVSFLRASWLLQKVVVLIGLLLLPNIALTNDPSAQMDELFGNCGKIRDSIEQNYPELLDGDEHLVGSNTQLVFTVERQQAVSLKPSKSTITTLRRSMECASGLLNSDVRWVNDLKQNNAALIVNQKKIGTKSGDLEVYLHTGYPTSDRWRKGEGLDTYIFESIQLDKVKLVQSYLNIDDRKVNPQTIFIQSVIHFSEESKATYTRIIVTLNIDGELSQASSNRVVLNSIFSLYHKSHNREKINEAFSVDKSQIVERY